MMKTLKKLIAVITAAVMVFGTLTVTAYAEDDVASIDGTPYESLEAAVEAVTDGQTILLGADYDTAHYNLIDLNGKTKKSFTIDLNGLNLTGDSSNPTFKFRNVDVTLKNGKISGDKNVGRAGIYAWSGCTITLGEGLEITGAGGNYGYIGTLGTSSAKCNMIIDGAYIHDCTCSHSSGAGVYAASNSSITILSGTIDCIVYAYAGPVTVEGGFFGESSGFGKGSSGSVSITGGYYYEEPGDYINYDAYEWIDDDSIDGYTGYVQEIQDAAKLVENVTTGAQYLTLTEAINDLSAAGQTLRLLDDFDGSNISIAISAAPYAFTLDLNGKTLSGSGSSRILEISGSNVTVINGTIASDEMTSNRGGIRVAGNGTVTLGEGLTVSGACQNLYGFIGNYNAGTIIIDGATITNMTSTSNDSGIYISSDGVLNIISGHIDTKIYGYAASGSTSSITITGGYFGENEAGASLYRGSTRCATTVTGGYYFYEPEYVASGYNVEDNDDPETMEAYPYKIVQGSIKATVAIGDGDSVQYPSVDAALAAAVDAGTTPVVIEILDDDEVKSGTSSSQYIFDAGANITINLNGYTLTRGTATRMLRLNGATMTISGGTVENDGERAYTGANGAFAYVDDGSTLNLNNVTVQNFIAGTNSSDVARSSGAIHIVGGSSVVMTGSTITNCHADDKGGAVTVTSGCTLTLDGDSSISYCNAPQGGAIYIDSNGNTGLFGKVYINGSITGCFSTGNDEYTADQPIYSNGFAYLNGTLTYEGAMVFQKSSAAEITSIGGALSDIVTITAYALVVPGQDFTEPVMYYSNGERLSADGTQTGTNTYSFNASVNINRLATNMNLRVVMDGKGVSPAIEYSVMDYFDELQKQGVTGAEETLMANLAYLAKALVDGQYAEGTEVVPFEWMDAARTDAAPAATYVKQTVVQATDSANYKIVSATLNVSEDIAVVFYVRTLEGGRTIIKLDGETVEDFTMPYNCEKGMVTAGSVSPALYDSQYIVELYNTSGELVHSVQYSVNAYCVSKAESDSDLAIAIYNYGTAAQALD
ncbi:MAG: hypothetical protein IJU01_05420 [Lachnospiraceae bacterium]|nr:hypothetical protein [Lachnospiraceae bacterium]